MLARPVARRQDDGERYPKAQVITSAAAGLAAGAAINFDLVTEDAGRAVGSYPRSA